MVAALVEFLIQGPPVSHQTRRRQRVRGYIEEVRVRAALAYTDPQPYDGMVRVEITYFYDARAGDVDNIAKPILDGLKGCVLADDSQVMDVVASKRPIATYRFVEPTPELLRLLAAGREFVRIRVLPFAPEDLWS